MTRDPLADFDREILAFLTSAGVAPQIVQLSTPPEREFGERAANAAFLLAKERRQPPRQIAQTIADSFQPEGYRFLARVEPAGAGFINFFLNYQTFVPHTVSEVRTAGAWFGRRADVPPERVIVEHTSVNPNKEWHIGHVRNAVLGDVVARLLRLVGDDVEVQNYIDDTGLQAAEAVLGLRDFPEPMMPGEKFDHYAGRLYVKIAGELAPETDRELRQRLQAIEARLAEDPEDEEAAREGSNLEVRLDNIQTLRQATLQIMHGLEEGEYRPLIDKILQGQLETAYRLGIYYELLNWESNLVESGVFDMAMEMLKTSPRVYTPDTGRYAGALVIQTGEAQGDEEPKAEVLIRSNGIPTYVAKDIAYHMWKLGLFLDRLCYVEYTRQPNGEILWSTSLHGEARAAKPPDRVINLIAVNQSQPQQAVKESIRAAGFAEQADRLFHLAYGLVSTAEGKISGRKGTGVAGDGVIDQAVQSAYDRVKEKRTQELTDDQMRSIAEAVGVGAIRYFMVQYNPLREIVFDVKDVVSYDGNTGLYVQYALVRMFAILRRAETDHHIETETIDHADASLLQHEQEKRLVWHLAQYPAVVNDAARMLTVNLLTEWAFDLATIFSQFYRDCAVLSAEPQLRAARLLLVRTVRDALASACGLLGVPVIERL